MSVSATDLKPAYRFFILGAGFSQPAGLPLAGELWAEVYKRQRNNISHALNHYIRFKEECDGQTVNPEEEIFDFEEFIGFLDIEHFLWLEGGDTMSDEGNAEQLAIRQEIGRVLSERTPAPGKIPSIYLDFARELKPHDYVLTFNYDTLLERALDEVGQKYRLFPFRYSEVDDIGGIGCTTESSEVTVSKMHGSVDWFSREGHDKSVAICGGKLPSNQAHPMFGRDNMGAGAKYQVVRLLEGCHFKDDPLRHLWRLRKAADTLSFYRSDHSGVAPSLLPPSTAKFIYLGGLLPLWHGLNKAGGYNLGMVFIGYSLPPHDNYAKQPLFTMAKNYQGVYWEESFIVGRKSPVVLIDRRLGKKSREEYRRRYGFVDPEKARFHFSGFDSEAVDLIREARRMAVGDAE